MILSVSATGIVTVTIRVRLGLGSRGIHPLSAHAHNHLVHRPDVLQHTRHQRAHVAPNEPQTRTTSTGIVPPIHVTQRTMRTSQTAHLHRERHLDVQIAVVVVHVLVPHRRLRRVTIAVATQCMASDHIHELSEVRRERRVATGAQRRVVTGVAREVPRRPSAKVQPVDQRSRLQRRRGVANDEDVFAS